MNVRFLPAGDSAVIVEFGDRIDRLLSERVLRLSALVRAAKLPGVIETVPTFRSLMVHYDPFATDSASLTVAIENLLDSSRGEAKPVTLWRIPACYAASHAPDLAEVAQRTGLGMEEIVGLHSNTRFHIYMLGFVPGFPYMGDLPEAMVLPRRADPRVRVPPGSIAIATSMTAIYPLESPGGWHLIGATPIRLFDPRRSRPALLSAGDAVRFEPITVREFDAIRAAVAADTYQVPCETTAA
ncbi:MAG: 5-oxoprolinase subunit PxpB [Betaproteobacteria bacterium]|nr:5-oxoprolinase subunit PxpB [Betaproteobacteria bacterium]